MKHNYTIKELPESEQPYEKCLLYGPDKLSDAELLSVIIRTGSDGRKAMDLANDVLSGHEGNLLNLFILSIHDLESINGIGKAKAIQLKCLTEISKRMSRYTYKKEMVYDQPKSIAHYFMESMRHLDHEIFKLAMFDSKFHMIAEKTLSSGTVNASLVSPREVFVESLSYKAVTIVVLHNHPSGDPTPSDSDKKVTDNLRRCGDFLNIELSDHIIIGDGKYFSFKEAGLLDLNINEQQHLRN